MLKVGIIGLGAVAAFYGKPEDAYPYCHVGGIRLNDKVQLAAVADLSSTAVEKFSSVWGNEFPDVNYYTSSMEMLRNESLDIVSVCVRGPYHHQVMMEVLGAGPRAVFLEKPPSCSLEEMDEMVSLAKEKNIPITVSYSRHWTPHVLKMQELVQEGLIGEVKTVVAYTGGNVLSFASHSTDLICQFAGYQPMAVYARGTVDGEAPAGYEAEPQLQAMIIEFENGAKGIQVGTSGDKGNFYCEVFGSKGSISAGMYIPPSAKTTEGTPIDLAPYDLPDNASVFTVAYGQIADYLNGGPLPHCTNDNFIQVNEIGFAAIESIHSGERIILPNQNRSRKIYANG